MVTNWSPSRHFLNPAIMFKKPRRAGNCLSPGSLFTLCLVFVRRLKSFRDSCVFICLFSRCETTRQTKQVSEDGGFRLINGEMNDHSTKEGPIMEHCDHLPSHAGDALIRLCIAKVLTVQVGISGNAVYLEVLHLSRPVKEWETKLI
ncbi:unnamed protein product [Menidia menidia]|uniref:(Atlantic silverside) hypothetical protein n=1 Tax=Menidia menidia TaxID=238744 RepID=A0A8S4A725_9TELE|nr:unnamed protein product [Menidia menidia]